jgi:HSP20 family protein
MKPIPFSYEESESFPKNVEEFFDLIARRPFDLLEKRPLLLGRELEHLFKTEQEMKRPLFFRLYETEENLVVRAEVPGYTERDLNIMCEPGRLVITGKKDYKEEAKIEKKEEIPAYLEKVHIYKTVKLPVEVKPDAGKATLRHGILEVTLPKAEVVKKIKDRGEAALSERILPPLPRVRRLMEGAHPWSFLWAVRSH